MLILGSLPGETSLAAGQYYAHARNAFWRLAGTIIERDDLCTLPYEQRIATLNAAGIGLWDAVATAERRGSLDAAIRQAEASDLPGLLARLPGLRAVGFNGSRAARIGRKTLACWQGPLVDLPSSSAANAAMPYSVKLARWLALKNFLAAPLNHDAAMDIESP